MTVFVRPPEKEIKGIVAPNLMAGGTSTQPGFLPLGHRIFRNVIGRNPGIDVCSGNRHQRLPANRHECPMVYHGIGRLRRRNVDQDRRRRHFFRQCAFGTVLIDRRQGDRNTPGRW